jgi:hypothetical protein
MTSQPSSTEFDCRSNGSGPDFHVQRSRWLDAFAALEIEVCKWMIYFECDQDARTTSLSTRLAHLGKVKQSSKLSTNQVPVLAELAKSFASVLATRASLAHGVLVQGTKGTEPAALFHNAADAAHGLPIFLVLTNEDFEASLQDVRRLATKVRDFKPILSKSASAEPATSRLKQ